MTVSAPPAPPRSGTRGAETSLGMSRRQAALLAYSAGWISGALVLWLEGRDAQTRWHAAQSVLGFGAIALLGLLFLGLAAVGLLWSLTLFRASLWAAQGLVVLGIALWLWSLVRVAFGGTPRWPFLGRHADRLAGAGPGI